MKYFFSLSVYLARLFGPCWSADVRPQPPTIEQVEDYLGAGKGPHICYHFWSISGRSNLAEDDLIKIATNRYAQKASDLKEKGFDLNYYTILIADFGLASNDADRANGKAYWQAIMPCQWVRVKVKNDPQEGSTCYYMTQDAYGKNKPLPNLTFARVVEGRGMLSSNSGYVLDSPKVVDSQKILVKLSYRRYSSGVWSWQVDTIHPVHSDELANYELA